MQVTSAVRPLTQANPPTQSHHTPATPSASEARTSDPVVFVWRRSSLVNSSPQTTTSPSSNSLPSGHSSIGRVGPATRPATGSSASSAPATPQRRSATEWQSTTSNSNTQSILVGSSSVNNGLRSSPTSVRQETAASEVNPLRSTSHVELANYQQVPSQQVPVAVPDPFAEQLQPVPMQPPAMSLPNLPQSLPPSPLTPLPDDDVPSLAPPNREPANDALARPEAAPIPNAAPGDPSGIGNRNDRSFPQDSLNLQLPDPAAPAETSKQEDASPFDRVNPNTAPQPDDGKPETDKDAEELALPNRKKSGISDTCDDQRQRARAPLTEHQINTSPEYGEGLRPNRTEQGKLREDFLSRSVIRQWADVHGNLLANGRMVDLRNEIITLDDNGAQRRIPLRDLSDADYAYAMKLWNLPTGCGSGDETYNGRNHIASAFQFKASGLCHKPLYFEEVQLERYGHEVGPVLQPLISSVHFFGNIAVLPYKMGIHPMHECQYALGYYRPGDCAPYMIPPIPWSLPGALSQARVVVGGAALIP